MPRLKDDGWRVLETRRDKDGFRQRRYRSTEGVVYQTIEIPLEVWRGINRQGHGNDRRAAWERSINRQTTRALAIQHMHEGWKAIASAHELGVPVRTIQRWRKTHKERRNAQEQR